MGEYADMLLDGSHDEQTGEYIGEAVGYPRTQQKGYYNSTLTPAEKNVRKVRKQLAILIKKLKAEGIQEPVGAARQYFNHKYGRGWRERGILNNPKDQWKPLNEY